MQTTKEKKKGISDAFSKILPLRSAMKCSVSAWLCTVAPQGSGSLLHTEPSLLQGFVQDHHSLQDPCLTGGGLWRVFKANRRERGSLLKTLV